jgi:peptidoglycan/LPS O-acetylase OafA/YrhL
VKTGELKALTSVRGIAAWLVVLFHIRKSCPWLPQDVIDVLAKGYLAVDFFFLLSGFVIWISYADRIRSGGRAAIPAFLQRRIARIWPLHIVMLSFAAALAVALAATGRGSPAFPFHELPLHVLLLQNWGFTDHLTWNDPAWSISCELGAYLLFPILALSIDWRKLPSWALIAAIMALLALLHLIFAASGATSMGQLIPSHGLIRCVLEFAAGTAIAALWLRWREQWKGPALIAACLSATAIAAWWLGAPETLTVPAAFAAGLLALALTAQHPGNPLEAAPIHYLGEISYATYLSHYMLWFAFKLLVVRDAHAVPPLEVAAFLALVAVASVALYHLVERPAQRWINALNILPGTKPHPAH